MSTDHEDDVQADIDRGFRATLDPTNPTPEPRAEHTGVDPCPRCGGGDCGRHPAGCVYGGFTEATGYWLVAEGCDLDHE